VKLGKSSVVFLVGDIAATIRWYEANLGFKANAFPPSPPHAFAILMRDEVDIMLQQLDGYVKPDLYSKRAGGVWNVYIRVTDLFQFYVDVKEHPDVRIIQRLHRQPYGQDEFEVMDPNGYVLVFAEAVKTE
jgi:catechol 2,3-dioxygenase-like lactoylglutathione lyase family enzyme